MRKVCLIALALVVAAGAPAAAKAKDNAGVTQFEAPPTALRPDQAYLLIRTSAAKSGLFPIQHVLLRVPSAAEAARYRAAKEAAYRLALPDMTRKSKGGRVPTIDEFAFDYAGSANAFVVSNGKFLEKGDMRTLLLEVPPGKYVLYGTTIGGRGLVTCNCLGTVQFDAGPGMITDVGSLYADKVHEPSPVPYLEDNLGPHMSQYGFIFGEALVPPEPSTPIPASLRQFGTVRASFEAVGQYYESGVASINRLAPVPGILSYVKGRPFDLKKGQLAH